MSESIASDQKATIASSADRVSCLLSDIERELGLDKEPTAMEMNKVSSDKINGVIGRLDSVCDRLGDVLASVSRIG